MVNGKHADQLFMSGSYQKAAEYYAQSNFNFETITRKFLTKKQNKALEIYLERVLDIYKSSKFVNNSVQCRVLATWLVELKLATLN